MKMLFPRYGSVRNRLIELHGILSHRVHGVWIAPKTMMSTEDLRGRYHLNQQGFANDVNFYNEPQLRQMKVPQIIDILPNIIDPADLGFQRANNSVPVIYESIQEYLMLWCEMIRTAPEFKSPPREELRLLEGLALILFPMYKRIKPFVTNQGIRDEARSNHHVERMGLASMGMLLTMNSMLGKQSNGEISFISHLDDLDATEQQQYAMDNGQFTPGNFFPTMPKLSNDSLLRVDDAADTNDWIFKAD